MTESTNTFVAVKKLKASLIILNIAWIIMSNYFQTDHTYNANCLKYLAKGNSDNELEGKKS